MRDSIVDEFSSVDLGDARLNRRAARIGEAWNAQPSASFPDIARSPAEIEGLYGFVENPNVSPQQIHASHAHATCLRIDASYLGRTVLVVHDTTSLCFPGDVHREGMGWLGRQKQGFFAHLSLAVASDGSRCPLGVVGVSIVMRARPDAPEPGKKKKKLMGRECAANPNSESRRWPAAVDETEALLRGHAIPIHVMDREADSYALLAKLVGEGKRFVIRVRVLDRVVTTDADGHAKREPLRGVATRSVPVASREIEINRRRKSKFADANKKHPPRMERSAKMEFAAHRVRMQRPKSLGEHIAATIDVNVVETREIETPEGVEPIHWLIVTSEPIGTADEVLCVVDHYRARWTIEELNKAIKTGCAYESRQLESAHALLIAFALCMPIAWQMLALRHQSRELPDAPAQTVLSDERLEVLAAIARSPLPAKPTVRDVFFAIAALGGHLKKNGPPGWITLRKGLDDLIFAERVWRARDREDVESSERSGG